MHEISDIDSAGLRRFGLTTGPIVAALFGLVLPWLLGNSLPRWPWIVAAVLIVWALAAPQTLRLVYRGWTRFGVLANRVTTPIILFLIFVLVLTPIGVVIRLAGHDPMRRRLDSDAATYREPSQPNSTQSMERPF